MRMAKKQMNGRATLVVSSEVLLGILATRGGVKSTRMEVIIVRTTVILVLIVIATVILVVVIILRGGVVIPVGVIEIIVTGGVDIRIEVKTI
ncbi:hypothetical protein DPMN_125588 [Dreissena polymorpha]|uniref:Uncharacterized protein n=1 Tax=Dreissena polymorpha TaxID=45954 RepID=A0A9D4GYH1_DREPO|nr:hypothetical protein DPMN_125588 [Dreissena polymorpha]